MIPPLPIDVYPANTLEGLIARAWVSMIWECCECHQLSNPEDAFQPVIARSRELMREAGWPCTYQRLFLIQLRNDLTELTNCHPLTRQFIEVLDTELESN